MDGSPGISIPMLDVLQQKVQNKPEMYHQVCLMLDAMAIKQQIQYCSKTKSHKGFVDLGDGSDEENVASEVLVFMVVGLQGHWKAPIAYFFTKTLRAESQQVLVEHALRALYDRGIRVVTLTMDGHASNMSMCARLGCQLKLTGDLCTFFPHPTTGQPVYVMMDTCHMLKLTRNMFQVYSPLMSHDGFISWSVIERLNDIQKEEGLRAANKITDKHVYFQNQKMKVSLAAQTLSRSVADALQFMKDSGHEDFKDCHATIKFIEVI